MNELMDNCSDVVLDYDAKAVNAIAGVDVLQVVSHCSEVSQAGHSSSCKIRCNNLLYK